MPSRCGCPILSPASAPLLRATGHFMSVENVMKVLFYSLESAMACFFSFLSLFPLTIFIVSFCFPSSDTPPSHSFFWYPSISPLLPGHFSFSPHRFTLPFLSIFFRVFLSSFSVSYFSISSVILLSLFSLSFLFFFTSLSPYFPSLFLLIIPSCRPLFLFLHSFLPFSFSLPANHLPSLDLHHFSFSDPMSTLFSLLSHSSSYLTSLLLLSLFLFPSLNPIPFTSSFPSLLIMTLSISPPSYIPSFLLLVFVLLFCRSPHPNPLPFLLLLVVFPFSFLFSISPPSDPLSSSWSYFHFLFLIL